MSKTLSRILGHDEHDMKMLINQLEEKNGFPSHDVRITADNIYKVKSKLADLGLDPADTTAHELYHGLLVKYEADCREFEKPFGAADFNFGQRLTKAVQLAVKDLDLPKGWVIKAPAAKKLLIKLPPKNLMKLYNYRSAESLIKRQKVSEIFALVNVTESQAWLKQYAKLVSQLDTTAFEVRHLELVAADYQRTKTLKTDRLFAYSNEYGSIAVLPSTSLSDAPLLSMVVLILEELSSLTGKSFKPQAEKLDSSAAWWRDMHHLIADMKDGPVSMNLADVATNHSRQNDYEDRILSAGQRSLWQKLLEKYDNHLEIEEDLGISAKPLISFKIPDNQPVFEYAEEI